MSCLDFCRCLSFLVSTPDTIDLFKLVSTPVRTTATYLGGAIEFNAVESSLLTRYLCAVSRSVHIHNSTTPAKHRLTDTFLGQGLDAHDLGGRLLFLAGILHKRERQHLADGVVVGQEHDHAVDAHAPTAGGREAELETGAEVLVDHLRLVVALGLLARLLLEPQALVERVVQLRVRVDNLLLAHKGLEAFADARQRPVVLGQGRHHLRVSRDEGRVDAPLLDELADELVQHAGVGLGRRAGHVAPLAQALEEFVRLGRVQLVARREFLARGFLQGRDHLDSLPRARPVDVVCLAGLGVESRLVPARDFLDQPRHQLLGAFHHVINVGIGFVELAGGEFGVVREIGAFVAELLAELVDTLNAAHHKHLEVQFWGDAHEHVGVVFVDVGDERLGRCTAGNRVHHRGLDLDKAVGIKVSANVGDDLGPREEDVARLVVHDQIQVTLAKPRLDVLQAIVLRGNLVQTGREKDDLGRKDG